MGISPLDFQKLQERVRSPRRAEPSLSATPKSNHHTVIGIDPSLRGTGWGVIQRRRNLWISLAFGTIRCPAAWPRTQCLVKIAAELRHVINTHSPTTCAIEGLFFAQNLQTALLMGEARGVCLLAVAEHALEVYEIAPRKVKQAIVGYGAAQKLAVARMVQRLLALPEPPDADAADALALALTHAQELARPTLAARRRL